MIYVYTCIMGGFDNLMPPLVPEEAGVRHICFTDVPVLPDVSPWEFRPIHDVGSPARTSRLPKILPHLMLPADADYSIWIDGNFQLAQPASEIINQELRFDDWAAHRHPARDCIYSEAEVLLKEKIGTPGLIMEQIERYSALGYPAAHGLWANGMIIRRHTPAVNALNEAWWKLYASGCERDQLSFPVARWQAGMQVNSMPHRGDVYSSDLMKFGWHAAWKDKPGNVVKRPERERIAGRVARLKAIAGDGGYIWRMY